ncbi:MAG: helix-turn-helix domain-containing protein [Geminicoccaceae bacterium]
MPQTAPIELVIDVLGLTQCLFFAGLLASVHRRANPANRFLIAFLLIYAINYIDYLVEDFELYRFAPHLTLLPDPLDLLLAPLIYFYVDEMVNGPGSSRRRWRHFAWPLLIVSLLLLPMQLLSADAKIALLIDDTDVDEDMLEALGVSIGHVILLLLGALLATLFFIGQVSTYLVLAIRMIRWHGRRVRDIFSNLELRTLGWLRHLLMLLTAYWLVFASAELADLGLFDFSDGFWMAMDVLELMMIYGLGFAALRQPSVFLQGAEIGAARVPDDTEEEAETAMELPRPKYAKSALEPADIQRIAAKLDRVMDEDQLFLDSDLTLPALAAHTGISANYISQAINEQRNCHFFDFVNRRRIEAAKSQLLEQRDRPILDIALDVGFNSKSTFNAAFKRFAGMTPSQYRRVEPDHPRSETSESAIGRPPL